MSANMTMALWVTLMLLAAGRRMKHFAPWPVEPVPMGGGSARGQPGQRSAE
jgi:hypothetical protein